MFLSPKQKIAVLVGCSSEREISNKTAAMVSAALAERGYHLVSLEINQDLAQQLLAEKPDAAFIASHGRFGEDGTVQGLLEILGVPYVGSGVLASALAMNKAMAKHIFRQFGLRTPEGWLFTENSSWREQLDPLYNHLLTKGQLIVKPIQQGSTIGLSVVRQSSELIEAIEMAFRYDDRVLVEWKIEGTELTVPVLGEHDPQVLPCIEIVPKNEIYDFEAKYSPGMSEHLIPPRLAPEISAEASKMALIAHVALGCRDISRSDFIADQQGNCWLLEVNTLPGMTETSLVPDSARAIGLSYADLVEKLVEMALKRS